MVAAACSRAPALTLQDRAVSTPESSQSLELSAALAGVPGQQHFELSEIGLKPPPIGSRSPEKLVNLGTVVPKPA
jgi:hypothetical protein